MLIFNRSLVHAESFTAAHPAVLFENGKQTESYTELVKILKAGDVVSLNGKKVTIKGFLGGGGVTSVFDIGGGYALRLPKAKGLYRGKVDYQYFIQSYLDGYNILRESGIVSVVYPQYSEAPNYLTVKKVDSNCNLMDFSYGKCKLPKLERSEAREKLREFAVKAAKYSAIADIKSDAIVWDGKSWTLLDYAGHVNLAEFPKDKNIFTEMDFLHPAYKIWLTQAIEAKRDLGADYQRDYVLSGKCDRDFNALARDLY